MKPFYPVVYISSVNTVAKAHLFTAVFSQLTIFSADSLYPDGGIKTVGELHTFTVDTVYLPQLL